MRWARRGSGGRRPRPQTWIGALLALVMFVILGTAIVAAEGFQSPNPELHDSGVWITRHDKLLVGRMNTEINTIDLALDSGSSQFDVLQSARHVFVRSENPPAILAVDAARALTIRGPDLPPSTEVQVGGDWAAVLVPGSALYLVPADELVAFDLARDPAPDPAATFDGSVELAVGLDGAAYVYDSQRGEVVRIEPGSAERETFPFPAGLDASLSVVGRTPVIVDRAALQLHFAGRQPVDLASFGSIPLLQQPGPAMDSVI